MYRFFLFFTLLFLSNVVFADTIYSVIEPGDVIIGHVKYEAECSNCHKSFDKKAQNKLCADCHKEIKKDIQTKHGLHGHEAINKECRECHDEHKGRNAKLSEIDTKTFKHDITGYKLKFAHTDEKVICKSCHEVGKKKRLTKDDCYSCHKKDDVKAAGHNGDLGKKCESCHIEKDWKKDTTFDHDKTDFKLKGVHVGNKAIVYGNNKGDKLKCSGCHARESKVVKYKVNKDCYSCHKEVDNNFGHKEQLGKKCDSCHNSESWNQENDIDFEHGRDTKFELKGKHFDVKCETCHNKTPYRYTYVTPKDCYSCHKKEDKHQGSLGKDCSSCHNEKSWKEQNGFNHSVDTKFTLRFKHVEAKCVACHKAAPVYKQEPMDCYSCHKKDDEDKGHKKHLGEKCESCHAEKGWKIDLKFDHNKDTKFMIKNKHDSATVKCESCHSGYINDKLGVKNKFTEKTSSDCYSCHKKDDEKKGHKGHLGEKCEKCHTDRGWKVEVKFDHNKDTKFALKFKHATSNVKCESCHTGYLDSTVGKNKFTEKTKSDCYSCHKKDDDKQGHNGTLGKKCEDCHSEKGWKADIRINHDKTKFPLLGKHQSTDCKSCHKTAQFNLAKPDCYSCHKKDDDKNGHQLRLGTNCKSCHNSRSWGSWDFNHNKQTKYRLDGKHQKIKCLECHTKQFNTEKISATSMCVTCHEKDDVHSSASGGFGRNCERCHTSRNWSEITNVTGF